jgi:hypothetical protein
MLFNDNPDARVIAAQEQKQQSVNGGATVRVFCNYTEMLIARIELQTLFLAINSGARSACFGNASFVSGLNCKVREMHATNAPRAAVLRANSSTIKQPLRCCILVYTRSIAGKSAARKTPGHNGMAAVLFRWRCLGRDRLQRRLRS